MYISAEGAAAQSRRLDVIANNMANVDTVGFKQDVATFQARYSEAIELGKSVPGDQSINNIGGGVKMFEVATDYSAGRYETTGNPLDLAITGPGFFHVRGADGQAYLTRAGDFSLDRKGRLITDSGNHPVLDQRFSEITLSSDVPWSITPDGFIVQDGNAKAIGLSQPKSLDDLEKVGDNMFRPLSKVTPVPLAERSVKQGYLELSGANSVREMMAMIESTRGFEANSRMIQSQDNATGTLISRVLRG
jgi:flagellar basal body rod protein FlgG